MDETTHPSVKNLINIFEKKPSPRNIRKFDRTRKNQEFPSYIQNFTDVKETKQSCNKKSDSEPENQYNKCTSELQKLNSPNNIDSEPPKHIPELSISIKSFKSMHNDFVRNYERHVERCQLFVVLNNRIEPEIKTNILDLINLLVEIGDKTKLFVEQLHERDNVQQIVLLFESNIPLFQLYPKYCHLLENIDAELKRKKTSNSNIRSYFPSIAGRIAKYQLFLDQIQIMLEKCNINCTELPQLKDTIASVSKQTNDALIIGKILDGPIDLHQAGTYYSKEKLLILEPIMCECNIYLLQEMIIAATVTDNSYVKHITVKNLQINSNDPYNITLVSFQSITK